MVIDYTLLHMYATDAKVDYNSLCAVVRSSVKSAPDALEVLKAAVQDYDSCKASICEMNCDWIDDARKLIK